MIRSLFLARRVSFFFGFFFFFKQMTAYEVLRSLVASEMCITDMGQTCPALHFPASALLPFCCGPGMPGPYGVLFPLTPHSPTFYNDFGGPRPHPIYYLLSIIFYL